MKTANDVVAIAFNEIGVKENPPGSNRVKYNDWFYKRQVSGDKYPWCMTFVQCVFDKAGVPLPSKTASCTELMNAAKKAGMFFTKDYRPGDIPIFTFNKQRTPQHCGIIRAVTKDSVISIEGNTGIGNDDNGGMVMERIRRFSTILGVVRPKFEEGIDMTTDEFIKSLTNKQAYDLLMKAREHAASLPEPSWSSKEGHWKGATAAKVVDGKRPEDYVKRDELAMILGRLDLL